MADLKTVIADALSRHSFIPAPSPVTRLGRCACGVGVGPGNYPHHVADVLLGLSAGVFSEGATND